MKMVMAIVPRAQADEVMESLVRAGYTATFTESRGGVLRQAQMILYIVVKAADVDTVLGIIRDHCHTCVAIGSARMAAPLGGVPVSAEVGWAMVFIWDIERVESY